MAITRPQWTSCRRYGAAQIFRVDSPLIVGTVAESFLPQLTEEITASVAAALTVKPNLAPAYFLRGWASFLAGQPRAQVKADVERAAALAPGDPLFSQAAQLLAGGPAPTATPQPGARRIQFAAGATSADIEGQLAAGGQAEYTLRAMQGQRMMVAVYSRNNDVFLAIQGADGQALLRPTARQANWAGTLPATQDYTIRVFSSGGGANYTLQVIIPRRVEFAPGATSAVIDANLAANQTHEYLLRARGGQTMTVTIKSPRNDVLVSIYGIEDGQPLVRVPMGQTSWTGKLPATQDYDVKAVAVGGATSYRIEFVIK